MNAALLILLLAQTEPIPPPHGQSRADASAEERCIDRCWKAHCDCFVGCNDSAQPVACKDGCIQRERSCRKTCSNPSTMRGAR